MGRKIFLIMVTGDNNNKYYNMIDNEDGTWTATYGRVDKTKVTKTYSMHNWDAKYREKLRKGYRDVTDLRKEPAQKDGKQTANVEIADTAVRELFNRLLRYANVSLTENYTISSESVTLAMVERAQEILGELAILVNKGSDARTLNRRLLELYEVIPRRMSNVRHHLVEPYGDVPQGRVGYLVREESDNVDVMEQQVSSRVKSDEPEAPKGVDLLAKMGVQVARVDDVALDKIRKLMLDGAYRGYNYRVENVYRVLHHRSRDAFDKYIQEAVEEAGDKAKKTATYWHGSRNENWLSIIDMGLRIKPSGVVTTGSMFGNGIYFAPRSGKSANYTSARGSYWAGGSSSIAYMALFDVHVGIPLVTDRHESWHYNLNWKGLRSRGKYHSLYAKGGADLINDEAIVYRPDQCTIAYLVEISS